MGAYGNAQTAELNRSHLLQMRDGRPVFTSTKSTGVGSDQGLPYTHLVQMLYIQASSTAVVCMPVSNLGA